MKNMMSKKVEIPDSELHFEMWLEELKELGYVEEITPQHTILLSEAVKYQKLSVLKTKSKLVDKILLEKHQYKMDFLVKWNLTAINLFICTVTNINRDLLYAEYTRGGLYTYIECKPIWDSQNMTRLFKINQKWTFEKFGIYVNLVIPEELFPKSFTPKKYLLTKTGKNKKINFNVVTLEEFLSKKIKL